ncbi:MAG: hypothetical protein ONB46_26405 [candidate division KSB1 bacterium]|nr:hypothetical protein [candidate division KSB1 bacterium]MDZ7369477.1 hypothetical protein [candidate division KSB1 bacterium]
MARRWQSGTLNGLEELSRAPTHHPQAITAAPRDEVIRATR